MLDSLRGWQALIVQMAGHAPLAGQVRHGHLPGSNAPEVKRIVIYD